MPFQLRTAHEFADLAFRDLEIAEPGLVVVSEWRPGNNAPRPLLSEVGINGQSRESRNSQRLANGRGNAHGRTQGKHGQSAAMRRLPHSNHVTVSVTCVSQNGYTEYAYWPILSYCDVFNIWRPVPCSGQQTRRQKPNLGKRP